MSKNFSSLMKFINNSIKNNMKRFIFLLILFISCTNNKQGTETRTEQLEGEKYEEVLDAEQGDADAQHNLSEMNDNEEGTEQDRQKAFEWVQKIAEQGDASAQFNLGVMYIKGDGTQQDYQKAKEWLQKAA